MIRRPVTRFGKAVTIDPATSVYLTAAGVVNDGTVYNSGTAQQRTGSQLYLATNTLFAASWRSKMAAMWPNVIDSATSHRLNAVNPIDSDAAFRCTDHGALTDSSLGVTGNGTTGYRDTHFNPSVQITGHAPFAFGINITVSNQNFGIDMGCNNGNTEDISTNNGQSVLIDYLQKQVSNDVLLNSYYEGFFILNFDGTTLKVYKDAELIMTVTSFSGNHPNANFYLLARNQNGTPLFFSSKTYDFAFISNGALTEAEVFQIDADVKTFNTSLGRAPQHITTTDGDSMAAGYPLNQPDWWITQYCAAKNTRSNNFAQYGTTMMEVDPVLANSMYSKAVAGSIPKYVYGMQNFFVCFINNDVLNNTTNYSPANLYTQTVFVINALKSQGWPSNKIYLQTSSYFEQAARDSYSGTNGVTVGRTLQGHLDMNNAVKSACADNGVTCIDNYTLVEENGGMENVGTDLLHLNERGHVLVADNAIIVAP